MGTEVVAACFVIDLPDLGGAKKIEALRRANPLSDSASPAIKI